MKETRILSINMLHKAVDTTEVRQILSQCDRSVRANEGLLEQSDDPEGLMMISLKGETQEIDKVEERIKKIKDLSIERLSL